MSLALALTPSGHLRLEYSELTEPKLGSDLIERLQAAFGASSAHGLEALGGEFLHDPMPATLAFWRGFAQRYFTEVCHQPEAADPAQFNLSAPTAEAWSAWIDGAPPMKGLEYLGTEALGRLWTELDEHVRREISRTTGGAPAYLKAKNEVWNTVGRVTFHLAENKRHPKLPFAFLATYPHGVSEHGKVRHLPLGQALEEYAGTRNRAALAVLLAPVQRAAERSALARELIESRAIFHAQAWGPAQAYAFLKSIPILEECGVVVRIPDWWKSARPPRPQVNVRIGEANLNLLGRDGLLDFRVELSLDGEPLSAEEVQAALNSTQGLVLLKGRWVEVDSERLKEVLHHWKAVEANAGSSGVSLLESMRLLSGFDPGQVGTPETESARAEWSSVIAGRGLARLLDELKDPAASAEADPGEKLHATLRPYQRIGVNWLWFMSRLGLGACLADDMGLGKTIQVIALLLTLKRQLVTPNTKRTVSQTSLLIVPASLLANWKSELLRFAPSLEVFLAHPAETDASTLGTVGKNPKRELAHRDLVITSYSMAVRLAWLKEMEWSLVILDEAQAIKNAGARQSRAVKALRARCRLALSGTPIENRLSDLWSLFDFLNPGLLGGVKEFTSFVKSRARLGPQAWVPLRRLVRPYLLRRLKTDPRIIGDLPAKTEVNAFCSLSRRQAALYQQSIQELAERLEGPTVEGIQRRGMILAFLMRLKQICNHPSQWLGDGSYSPADSGKFQRLADLCEEIASRQEKVLVFSQFREIAEPLERYLAGVFGQSGLVLHGGTPVGRRQALVNAFQREDGPPFFVLSLKAGGTGLNLTAASHVIHFDRWWNPAVENQATDRVFRIGQMRNVMVHKFICQGTLEDRIHALIEAKSTLAADILGEGAERLLTEMNNSELLRFVALDITAASSE